MQSGACKFEINDQHSAGTELFRKTYTMSSISKDTSPFVRGVLIMVLAGLVLSTGGPIIRQIEEASGFQIVFWRSVTMAVFIFLILLARDRASIVATLRGIGIPGISGGLFLGIGFFGYVFSITNTSVANTLFLISTVPFFTAIFASLLLREKVGKPTIIAIIVALIGVTIMVGQGLNAGRWLGNVMGIVCAVATSLYIISIRYGSVRYERVTDMVPTVCVAGVIGAIIAFIIEGGSVGISTNDLAWCAVAGAFQVGLGFMLYTMGSRYVRAAELSLLGLIEVIIGPIAVWLLLAELPDIYTVIGGSVVLLAIAGLALWSLRTPQPGNVS